MERSALAAPLLEEGNVRDDAWARRAAAGRARRIRGLPARTGYIVASSNEFPHSNSPGDNPPHRKARNRYEEIVNTEFLCTGEVSTPEHVRPIIFTATARHGAGRRGLQMSESAEKHWRPRSRGPGHQRTARDQGRLRHE